MRKYLPAKAFCIISSRKLHSKYGKDMHGDLSAKDPGRMTEVILESTNEQVHNVIDRFGNENEICKVDDKYTRVRVKTLDCPAFYSWVYGFNGDIQIVEPRAAVKQYRGMILKGFS